MKSIQYPIRSIPQPVDKKLRQAAQDSGKSFNSVVVEALQKVTNTSNQQNFHDRLDKYFGTGIHDNKSFDEAMELLNNQPNNMDDNFSL